MSTAAREASRPEISVSARPRPGMKVADWLLIVVVLIWGINYSVIKYATSVMSPFAYNAVRVPLAATALLALAALRREPWPPRRLALSLMALGMLGNSVYQMLFVIGLTRTRAGTAALVVGGGPALVAIIGRLRGVEHASRRHWTGIALQLAGVFCVMLGSAVHEQANDTFLGACLVVLGSASWAWFTVSLKGRSAHTSSLRLASLTMAGGALLVLVVCIPAVLTTPWRAVSPSAWGAIAYGGLGSLVVAYLCWAYGVKKLGPTRTALYLNLQPLVALSVAWMMLGERPTVWQMTGAALITAGLVLGRA